MSEETTVKVRVGAISAVVSSVVTALAIGGVVLAEGANRGAQSKDIEALKEWKAQVTADFRDFDSRLRNVDSNVQWIRGALGGNRNGGGE